MDKVNFVVTDPEELRVINIAMAFAYAAIQEGCEQIAEFMWMEMLKTAAMTGEKKLNDLIVRIAEEGAKVEGMSVTVLPHPNRTKRNPKLN